MSASIPLSLSLAVPLLISKETNVYYKLKNVIEYDTEGDIVLGEIDREKLINERDEIVSKNVDLFDKYVTTIQSNHTK
jgi:hypothetical protein